MLKIRVIQYCFNAIFAEKLGLKYNLLYFSGVLNCSEAAIRHARVVQEWGSTVQVMFEEMKDERMKMQVKNIKAILYICYKFITPGKHAR